MPIRLKLIVIFIAVTLIPILFVSAITFNNYKDSLMSARLSELQHLAAVKAERIEAYFAELKLFVELGQNAYFVRKYLPVLSRFTGETANPEFIAAKDALDNMLQKPQKALRLSDIMLVNPEGNVVYTSDPMHYRAEFSKSLSEFEKQAVAEGMDKIYLSGIFFKKVEGQGNFPEILVTAPVHDLNGAFIGSIIAEVDMRPAYSLIQDTVGMGDTGEVLIGKKAGNQAIFLNPLRHDPQGTLNRRITFGDKIGFGIQEAVQGRTGSGHTIDYRGKHVIAAWRYIPSLGWGMVAKIDIDEAFRDIERLKYLIGVILIIIAVLGGVTAISIAQSIARPLKNLTKGAQIIGSGKLDHKVGTDLKDEVGQLSRAFDKMSENLKTAAAISNAERQRLYDVLEALPVYVVLLDKDYRVPFANKFFRERFGESHGKRCYEYLFNRTDACEDCETYKVMKTNAPHHWEWTGPDNRNYDIYDFPFIDSDGSKMIMEMGIDITAVKKTEAELKSSRDSLEVLVEERTGQLKESEEDLKRAQAVGNMGSWRLNIQSNKLVWSDEVYRIFGIPNGTLLTYEMFISMVHPDDRDYIDKMWKEAIAGKDYDIEHRIIAGGVVKWVREKAFLEFDEKGAILAGVGITQDITKYKQAEELVRRSKEEWERTFDSVPDMIAILDNKHKIIRANKAMANALSLSPEKCTGLSCFEHVHGTLCPPDFCPHAQTLKDGKEHIAEIHEKRLGGDFLVSTTPIFDEKGRMTGAVHVARDITLRKKAEKILKRDNDTLERLIGEKTEELISAHMELDKAKRLSDIGTLAATVAHELRNPLAAISMAAANIKRKANNPNLDKHLINIEKKVTESDQIINNLLFYSRIKPPTYESINIYSVIEECIDSAKEKSKKNAAFDNNAERIKNLSIMADPIQIKEVLNNVFNNAIDAIPEEKGMIRIDAEDEKDYVTVNVNDNGAGIDKNHLDRIFDPFFTTKSKGTGLGLSVCRQIIDFHGGSIDIKSAPAQGTTVAIRLPKDGNSHEK